jgi:alpha-tubulin suppressor-like RCC1 family protein
MSATLAANVNVSGTLTVQGILLSNTFSLTTGNVSTTLGSVSFATGIFVGSQAYHSAIVMSDGTVRVCGINSNGQLGQNDVITRSTVVAVLGISSQAIAVSCGQQHTAILLNDGTVRVCGQNNSGQLGLNDLVTRSTVVPVLGISSQAIAVSCGRYHTAILLNDGTVRVCGANANGQLGQNDVVARSTIVPVLGISSQVIAVSCGRYHTAILLNNGTVRVCGINNNGQLGQNDVVARSTVVPVLGISSQAIVVSCGRYHTAILLNDGTVRACGINSNGQLGQNDVVARSTVVPVLGISSQAIAIACGSYHTAILLNNGTVRVCGINSNGQLGQNDVVARSTVVPVLGISSQAIAVACGAYHTAILLNNGTVQVCGRNDSGQLGLNDLVTRSTVVVAVLGLTSPVVSIVKATPTTSLGVGSVAYHSAFVMSNGTVRVCGLNSSGQLGQNNTANRSTVVAVLGISSQAIAVSYGSQHTAILLNNGTVRTCGLNNNGQLGLNDTVNRSTVVAVVGISSQAIAVACGAYHTAILLNNGTVQVCGNNGKGQLGQNDLVTRSTVVSVLGISSQAIAVSCGKYHTAILLNNGTVKVCGQNNVAQLGTNDKTNRSTPVPVLGISSQAIAVSCGRYHTAILLNNGTVRVCGANANGQLGQNDVVSTRVTFVPVLGISSQAIAVACGAYQTAILLNDGTVRACGRNDRGQLGLNDVITRSTVVAILGISSQAIAVSFGRYHAAILLSDGTVRVCGSGANGQLGQNDVLTRSTLVSVTLGMPRNAILTAPALRLGTVPTSSFQLDMDSDLARKLTTTTWTTGSDENLKNDIVLADLDRCVKIVSGLDLKYFTWDGVPSSDKHSLGWIAQDVEQFLPKSVITSEAHGISDFKNLNSDQIIKVMWGALKKLRADLKAKQTP